jgi:hypothetical protein
MRWRCYQNDAVSPLYLDDCRQLTNNNTCNNLADSLVLPPLLAGGAAVTKTTPFPLSTCAIVGASGTPSGVTGGVDDDSGERCAAVDACTVNVYATPFVKPLT